MTWDCWLTLLRRLRWKPSLPSQRGSHCSVASSQSDTSQWIKMDASVSPLKRKVSSENWPSPETPFWCTTNVWQTFSSFSSPQKLSINAQAVASLGSLLNTKGLIYIILFKQKIKKKILKILYHQTIQELSKIYKIFKFFYVTV